jgi:hypothetical protein
MKAMSQRTDCCGAKIVSHQGRLQFRRWRKAARSSARVCFAGIGFNKEPDGGFAKFIQYDLTVRSVEPSSQR